MPLLISLHDFFSIKFNHSIHFWNVSGLVIVSNLKVEGCEFESMIKSYQRLPVVSSLTFSIKWLDWRVKAPNGY